MPLKETLTRKVGPLPVWAYGAGAIAGAAGLVWIARRKAAAGSPAGADGSLPYPSSGQGLSGGGGGGGDLGGYGGGGSDSPGDYLPQPPPSPTQQPKVRQPATVTQQPTGSFAGLTTFSQDYVTNPVGYTANEAKTQQFYTPSLLDFATESGPGLLESIVQPTGSTVAGGTSTIYQAPSGYDITPQLQGPIIQPSQFTVGERYAPVAGGYQVIA